MKIVEYICKIDMYINIFDGREHSPNKSLKNVCFHKKVEKKRVFMNKLIYMFIYMFKRLTHVYKYISWCSPKNKTIKNITFCSCRT